MVRLAFVALMSDLESAFISIFQVGKTQKALIFDNG
jgi:hypothetical protein